MNKLTLTLTAFAMSLVTALPGSALPLKQGAKAPDMRNYVDKASLAKWPSAKVSHGATRLEKLSPSNLTPKQTINVKEFATENSSKSFKCALLYSDNWEEDEELYGAYSFNLTNPNVFTSLYRNTDYPVNGGGFFTDGKYYFTSYVADSWGYDYEVKTYIVDTNTWKVSSTVTQSNLYALATDLSYDPVENVAFGSFYSGQDGKSYWGYMNLETCEVTQIALLDGSLVAVAVNEQGQAYAITDAGVLVKVDKYTGKLTVIGKTGITPSYLQSATFDEDGTLYWAASFTDGSTGLFTVDTTNGHVTRVNAFTNYEEVVALYADPKAADEGAPKEATNLALNFIDAALTGVFSFDIPAQDNQGADISGNVNYTVFVDGVQSTTGTATAGGSATLTLSVANAGVHTFAVKLSNDKGSSKRASISKWIGIDRPVAVTDLTLTKLDKFKASLSWTAPTKGARDGFFDASRLSYTVTRLSDNVVVASNLKATTLEDELKLDGQAYVTYQVTAYADDVEGASAVSNGAVFGNPFVPPVQFDFNTEADYNLFTVIDTNETVSQDSGCWLYSPSGQCAGYNCGTKDGDDWLITPDIELKSDREYVFSYEVLCYSNYWPDNYELYMGAGATIEAMKTKLVENTEIYWEDYRTNTLKVTVNEDGIYNFGFRALSEAGGAFFLVDSIVVSEGHMLKAPTAVTDLKAVAGDKDSFSATVSFKAPSVAVDSTKLESISKIVVSRNGEAVKTFENPAPGESLSFVDENITAAGNYTYTVVPENAVGVGVSSETTVWVGIDTPVEPSNVFVSLKDSHPVLSWEAPVGRGANGGYVDTDSLTYIVYSQDADDVLASDLKTLNYTDTLASISDEGTQKVHQYGIYAKSVAGIGNPAIAYAISGEKYSLPFTESFKNGSTSQLWAISGTYESWSISDDWSGTPQDGDGGMLLFLPYTAGGESTIFSGKIDMKDSKNPSLSFYLDAMGYEGTGYYETDPNDDVLDVQIGTTGFQLKTIKSIHPADLEKGKYIKYDIPLDEYQNADFIFIGFTYHAGAAQSPVALDNIVVKNNHAVNMAITDFTVPASVNVTEKFTASVTVKNDANKPAQNYVVTVKRGEQVVATTTESETLEGGESKTYSYELEALASWDDTEKFTAEVSLTGDEVEDDNVAEATLQLVRPNMPVVSDLAGQLSDDGVATFTWSAAEVPTVETVTEDFESYTHGAISKVGDWTLYDADQVLGVDDIKVGSDYVDIPHSMARQSFMVFDPQKGDIDLTAYPQWAPYSGKQMMVSFRNWEYDNDDWLITPELSGNAQTVTFYARSPKEEKDKINVYYSTTDTKTSSFTDNRIDAVTLTSTWTKYSYQLPEGAKYLAIRNNKYNGEAVLIDDVRFEKKAGGAVAVTIDGYNLYRDNEKVNTSVITATTYKVTESVAGSYYVTVVCNVGESKPSNVVSIEASGVENVSIDADSEAPVYDLYGRRVNQMVNGQIYVTKGKKFIYRR
jgi:hypothetical protein